ncbi:Mpp10 protein-domain-containing protein [Lasiosphaeris hirsuta]|uniref:U3 small nucleolar ribonucleoprotein protein MPP10 n=1 Tax=Lasiosphaeris hirsuta TaxID=260670 RepID=A0AA40A326_9PEZI|nr:Mpp10 protein-domain-containing protein [Lasiosphaeris hirsuta]
MAGTSSTTSSLTSTSHTLTHAPSMVPSSAMTGVEDGSAVAVFLDSTAASNRHVFLQPSPSLPAGSIQLAKETLDNLASQVIDLQQLRLQEAGKKRKREIQDKSAVLKLRKLHTDGFETGQVWQQAKKIITSTLHESTQILEELEALQEVGLSSDDEVVKAVRFGEDGFEIGSDEDESASASSQSGSDADSEDFDEDDEDEGSDISDEEGLEALEDSEDGLELEEDEDSEEGDEEEDDVEDEDEEGGYEEEGAPAVEFVKDPNGLNDGFFSLDEFNKQTQIFEALDARADPNADNHSDDESVDWHGDPFQVSGKGDKMALDDDDESDVDMETDGLPKGGLKDALADAEEEEEEDEDEEDDGDDIGILEMDLTADDIYYKDFFAPPAKKAAKPGKWNRKDRVLAPKKPAPIDDADIERAENDVRRDLFDDLSEQSDSVNAPSDASAGNLKSRRSALERRQAKIADEIRKFESELVAKRAWTLSGEASAMDRPKNALLEEDLDFEHVGKPVPVITEEVSESIETLIKRRILAQEFDDIIRRRPDTFGNPNTARRGLVEVEDTKGKKSLAEIYEEEHIKKSNPDAYLSQADEKLQRDEEEIKTMWKDISAKLDALSSWHYKPKPAAPTLTVVADVATVAMEDAQPTTAQGVTGGESMIAPQEVYAPGKGSAEHGEVVAKNGLPVARQEMTREDKLRRRRRDKERIRKAGGLDATKSLSKKAESERDTMKDLKKGGVRVINRKGEIMDMDGKKATEQKTVHTSGSYKL